MKKTSAILAVVAALCATGLAAQAPHGAPPEGAGQHRPEGHAHAGHPHREAHGGRPPHGARFQEPRFHGLPQLAENFATADADQDGHLTAEEMTGFLMPQMQTDLEARTATLIERLDQDGDGKLSADELSPPKRDLFAELDKDGDGQISKEEFEAMHKAHPRGAKPE